MALSRHSLLTSIPVLGCILLLCGSCATLQSFITYPSAREPEQQQAMSSAQEVSPEPALEPESPAATRQEQPPVQEPQQAAPNFAPATEPESASHVTEFGSQNLPPGEQDYTQSRDSATPQEPAAEPEESTESAQGYDRGDDQTSTPDLLPQKTETQEQQPTWTGPTFPDGEPYTRRMIERLAWAGDNRAALEGYLAGVAREERWAAIFMIENLPPSDLGTITASDLLTNHILAFRARKELPWGKEIPDRIFLHYVLPYHISQEPIQPWRTELYESLKARLKEVKTIEQAALELNRWAGEKIKFQQTEFRDQGPLTSLKRGIGRCEEMMGLYIAAARTMSVPARPCGTPWWAVNDNNHAWVEVWSNGKWYYLGGGEPQTELNNAWFNHEARRAMMVRSVAFGAMPEGGSATDEVLYKNGTDFALLNSTPNYTRVGTLKIRVLQDGLPAPGIPVHLSVFNYGALRSIAKQITDETGRVEFITGPGTLIASAGTDTLRAVDRAVVTSDSVSELTLHLRPEASIPQAFWLFYPKFED